MRLMWMSLVVFLAACSQTPNLASDWVQGDITTQPGWVSVFQTMTSDSETTLNIMRPRLADMDYSVEVYNGQDPHAWDPTKKQKIVKTVEGPQVHWKVERIHVTGLKPNTTYRLAVFNRYRKKVVDWRLFHTLDLKKKTTKFIVGSCMSDSYAFEHVRKRIWNRMLSDKPDFMVLLGDQVYVDDRDFVKRDKATEFDLWARYIDSFRQIPLFQERNLIPLMAVWDDHDFGSNNSDKNFKEKKAAKEVFTAFFGGVPPKGVYDVAGNGVYFSFKGFGQKFVMMDNRYFREPKGGNPYGHWGKAQHQWFKKQLQEAHGPIWLANGGQFFTKATEKEQKDGKKKQINESFVDDHPKHFANLLNDLKVTKQPVVFLSGDVHYSEIASIEKEVLGYPTYEITSSPIHSFLYRSADPKKRWLNNPRRLVSHRDHNYLLIEADASSKSISMDIKSFGVQQKAPYFEKQLKVVR